MSWNLAGGPKVMRIFFANHQDVCCCNKHCNLQGELAGLHTVELFHTNSEFMCKIFSKKTNRLLNLYVSAHQYFMGFCWSFQIVSKKWFDWWNLCPFNDVTRPWNKDSQHQQLTCSLVNSESLNHWITAHSDGSVWLSESLSENKQYFNLKLHFQ